MHPKRLVVLTAALCGLALGTAFAEDQHPVKDSYITTKVKSELVGDFGKRATHISVKTKDGVVALTGHVNSDDAKDRAEHDAKGVKGVVDVINKLEVKP
ncbi:MAG TPA: BON domain-containing protein [Gemmatimonadaceae bacterium]|nr:BON domain-containing protein [Gemmatimonadaceae bacterium]